MRRSRNVSFLLIFLGLFGVFIATINTPSAYADDITVTASVNAPLPITPAVITSPGDQEHVTTERITVEGTCDLNTAYVLLYRNNLLVAIVPCIDGHFTTEITLEEGPNRLFARSFNKTDNEGPASTEITVFYDRPLSPPPESNPPFFSPPPGLAAPTLCQPAAAQPPFSLYLQPKFMLYKTGQTTSWNFRILGGTPPYILVVDWKDNATPSTATPDATGNVRVDHAFSKAATHLPRAYAADACGHEAELPFFATVVDDPTTLTISTPQPPGYIWIVAILIFISLIILALLDTELLFETFIRFFGRNREK